MPMRPRQGAREKPDSRDLQGMTGGAIGQGSESASISQS
jgi:hypothetical protein